MAILSVPSTYPTIQDAINAVSNGDEIELYPGYYSAINIKSNNNNPHFSIKSTQNGVSSINN